MVGVTNVALDRVLLGGYDPLHSVKEIIKMPKAMAARATYQYVPVGLGGWKDEWN